MAKKFWINLVDLMFPPRCTFCRKFLKPREAGICAECRETLPYTGGDAGKSGDFFTICVSPLYYEDTVRASLLRYKFGGRFEYAKSYAPIMLNAIEERLSGQYDLITWVPLSGKRKEKRGYDQSFLLASEIAALKNDVAVETLRKVSDNPAQSGLDSAEKRRANVLGSYSVIDAELITGKRLLLIDDIVTTGATLSEASKTLLLAGAENIMCATLAKVR